jgi:hypothetical protein
MTARDAAHLMQSFPQMYFGPGKTCEFFHVEPDAPFFFSFQKMKLPATRTQAWKFDPSERRELAWKLTLRVRRPAGATFCFTSHMRLYVRELQNCIQAPLRQNSTYTMRICARNRSRHAEESRTCPFIAYICFYIQLAWHKQHKHLAFHVCRISFTDEIDVMRPAAMINSQGNILTKLTELEQKVGLCLNLMF